MKAFSISVILLVCMILLIVCDILYCSGVCSELEKMLEKIETSPAKSAEDVDDIINYWDKHEPFVHLGTNTGYTDRVTEKLIYLKDAVSAGDAFETASTVSLLKNYVSELKRINGISLENIF